MDKNEAEGLVMVAVVGLIILWAVPGGIAMTRSRRWWFGVEHGITTLKLSNVIKWWIITLIIGSVGTVAALYILDPEGFANVAQELISEGG